jgi:hypothetical protein
VHVQKLLDVFAAWTMHFSNCDERKTNAMHLQSKVYTITPADVDHISVEPAKSHLVCI